MVTWGCGTGNYGQCTLPAGLSGVKAIGAGPAHSLAVKQDGTVASVLPQMQTRKELYDLLGYVPGQQWNFPNDRG